MEQEKEEHTLKRELGLFDGVMLVVGSMIGSGIFIVSADITRNVGSAGWLILVWALTGVVTIVAAVSYGELSALFPKAGGQYVGSWKAGSKEGRGALTWANGGRWEGLFVGDQRTEGTMVEQPR